MISEINSFFQNLTGEHNQWPVVNADTSALSAGQCFAIAQFVESEDSQHCKYKFS